MIDTAPHPVGTQTLSHLGTSLPPVTASELATALGISERAVRKAAHRYGPSLDPTRHLWDPNALPEYARRKVLGIRKAADRDRAASLVAVADISTRYTVDLASFTDHEQSIGAQRRDFILEVERANIDEPRSCLHECVDKIAAREMRAAQRHDGSLKYKDLLIGGKRFANTMTYTNFLRWRARWKDWRTGPLDTNNWWSLCDHYAHPSYERPGDDKFWHILAALYEAPTGRNLSNSYETAIEQSKRAGCVNFPTLRQVRFYYSQKAPAQELAAKRLGAKHVYDRLSVHVIRKWTKVQPNLCWSGDHHNIRIFCRVFDVHLNGWIAVTPWLTNWIDVSSWYEVGIHWGTMPNRDSIELALKAAIAHIGGCPESVYIDNGKDYRAAFPGSDQLGYDESRARSICESLRIIPIFAIPHNPRAKINERDYRIVTEHFETLFPSYAGRNKVELDRLWRYNHPSDGICLADRQKRDKSGRLLTPELLPTVEEVRDAYVAWRRDKRHHMVSQGRILRGESPHSRFHPPISHPPISNLKSHLRPLTTAEIAQAFLRVTGSQKVQRGGLVYYCPPRGKQFDRIFYRSDHLLPYVGCRVQLRADLTYTPPRLFAFETIESQDRNESIATHRHIPCDGPDGCIPTVTEIDAFTGDQEALRREMAHNRAIERDLKKAEIADDEREMLGDLPSRVTGVERHEKPEPYILRPQTERARQRAETQKQVDQVRSNLPADLVKAYRGENEDE